MAGVIVIFLLLIIAGLSISKFHDRDRIKQLERGNKILDETITGISYDRDRLGAEMSKLSTTLAARNDSNFGSRGL